MKDLSGHQPGDSGTARPRLIYDGDCAFCAFWARYWQRLTGDSVEYRPYQQVLPEYPEIPLGDFQRAVQYVTPDGQHASAAEASFLTLSHARGKRFWLMLYRKLPGFAALSEFVYAIIAANRSALYPVSLALWGRDYQPPRYDLVAFLFTRLFGLIYLSAFISFGVQAPGLIGSHGILPLANMVENIYYRIGPDGFFEFPMLFWINASDFMIQAVCWAGAGFALLVAFNVLPRLGLLLCYVFYLSLFYAGQVFMSYQWDLFLLEAGFLALVLNFATRARHLAAALAPVPVHVHVRRGETRQRRHNWWNLTALTYHFQTQPLPTPLAWYAAQSPVGFLQFATGATFVIELILPFFIFCPRRIRFAAAFGFLLLETLILLTGNYNWFNLQTALLCLVLFDDAALRKIMPERWLRHLPGWSGGTIAPKPAGITMRVIVGVILFCSLVQLDDRFGGGAPSLALDVASVFDPLRLTSSYGLFAVMTTKRNEIVLEGSNDGAHWLPYEFWYKPGDVTRAPPINIPHQPRLDWQLWFAALENPNRLPWFWQFVHRLLEK